MDTSGGSPTHKQRDEKGPCARNSEDHLGELTSQKRQKLTLGRLGLPAAGAICDRSVLIIRQQALAFYFQMNPPNERTLERSAGNTGGHELLGSGTLVHRTWLAELLALVLFEVA